MIRNKEMRIYAYLNKLILGIKKLFEYIPLILISNFNPIPH